MPFKKLGHGKYKGPSGRVFNLAQVRLYYSGGGKFPGQKSDTGNKRAAKHLANGHPKARRSKVHQAMA